MKLCNEDLRKYLNKYKPIGLLLNIINKIAKKFKIKKDFNKFLY